MTSNPNQNFQSGMAEVDRDMLEAHIREQAGVFGLEYVNIGAFPVNPDLVSIVSEEAGRAALAVPFLGSGKTIKLAVVEPDNPETQKLIDILKNQEYEPELSLASREGVIESWDRLARMIITSKKNENIEDVLANVNIKNVGEMQKLIEDTDSKNSLNIIIAGAVGLKSSDIHFEPYQNEVRVRFRIDGVLVIVLKIKHDEYHEILTQIKFASKMKLNVLKLPQDGRMSFHQSGKNVDIRVSTMPTKFGDTTVLRLLDKEKVALEFDVLGFSEEQKAIIQIAIVRPNGMILTTGPTSSGKTTTLYTILNFLNTPERKIITLEDPIEYELEGVVQSQVTSAEELEEGSKTHQYTFSKGLRAILRQNPNIIMVGEIRDRETAEIAAESALTGHLVLSTIHTNDAVSTITRFLDMGLEPFLIAPSLDLIMAQRLVRRLCECKQKRALTEDERKRIASVIPSEEIPNEVATEVGCDRCSHTGYHGQLGLYEMLLVDEDIRSLILDRAKNSDISAMAKKKGMKPLIEDGIRKALAGITSLEEVFRVASEN